MVGIKQRILNLKQGQTPLYDADQDVAALVADAVAEAEVLGAVKIGDSSGGFSRAMLANGTTESRGAESTLGNLVAEVQRAQTPATVGGAQIAFMNPGGLRADMVGTGTGAFPRELTYKQAATVQPFANTLVNMDLTGAQIKQALEQQWQPGGASRPFLRLGASKGFTYTYDPDAAAGSRITGMWLDGVPVEAGTSYSVTVNSFLSTGGDNFGAFAGGANKQDTGVTDLQEMVDYMEANTGGANPPLPVDSSQRAVGVNFPADAPATYAPGDSIQFGLTSLSMTGPGDVTDASVSVSLDGVELGTAAVTTTKQTALPGFDEAGTASVNVTVPDGVESGPATLVVTGATTGTQVRVPVTLEAGEPELETTTVSGSASAYNYGTAGSVDVTVSSATEATGQVEVRNGTEVLATGSLTDAMATLSLPGTSLTPGTHELEVGYLGDATHAPSTGTVSVTVRKAVTTISVDRSPNIVIRNQTRVRLDVTVSAPGFPVAGTVRVRPMGAGYQLNGELVNGQVTFRLEPFKTIGRKRVVVRFLGSDLARPVRQEITFQVRRR